MRRRHLMFKLRMALVEALGNDIIDKAITVQQSVTGLAASETSGGVGLILRHSANEKIHFLFTKGIGRANDCVDRRRGGFDSAHEGGRSGVAVPRICWRGRRNIASNLNGILYECCGELRHREVERKGVFCPSGSTITFHEAAEFGAPLTGEVTNAQIQSFVLRVVATGNAFTCEEILKATKIRTELFSSSLTWDLVDSMNRDLETWMVETEQGIDSIVPCVGSTTLDGAMFFAPGREDGLL